MVKHAAGRCINQLGKADLNYIEGILKRWRKDGIKTVADAMKKDTLPKGNKPVQGRKDVTSFNNYDQRTYDYDSLEKRLLGWRMKMNNLHLSWPAMQRFGLRKKKIRKNGKQKFINGSRGSLSWKLRCPGIL